MLPEGAGRYGKTDEVWEDAGLKLEVGDIVKMKKQHPCGSREWELLRVGMDLKMKCLGCGHQIMIARPQAEKNIRGITPAGKETASRTGPK